MPRSWRVIEGGNTGDAKKSKATLMVIDRDQNVDRDELTMQWLNIAIAAFRKEHNLEIKA